jgi:hypothetical protein
MVFSSVRKLVSSGEEEAGAEMALVVGSMERESCV